MKIKFLLPLAFLSFLLPSNGATLRVVLEGDLDTVSSTIPISLTFLVDEQATPDFTTEFFPGDSFDTQVIFLNSIVGFSVSLNGVTQFDETSFGDFDGVLGVEDDGGTDLVFFDVDSESSNRTISVSGIYNLNTFAGADSVDDIVVDGLLNLTDVFFEGSGFQGTQFEDGFALLTTTSVTSIPEPSSAFLLVSTVGFALFLRRRTLG